MKVEDLRVGDRFLDDGVEWRVTGFDLLQPKSYRIVRVQRADGAGVHGDGKCGDHVGMIIPVGTECETTGEKRGH